MVHVYVPEGIRQAIRAGVKSIEHGHLIDEETMKMIADNGVWLSMQPVHGRRQHLPERRTTAASTRRSSPARTTRTSSQKKYGVRLAWGTDLLFNPAKAKDQNRGIAKLARWFSNYEILKMVTRDNAELLALSGRRNPYPGPLGTIETDALADLLLVDGNPLENIELLTEPEKNFLLIVKDGTIYKRQASEGAGPARGPPNGENTNGPSSWEHSPQSIPANNPIRPKLGAHSKRKRPPRPRRAKSRRRSEPFLLCT